MNLIMWLACKGLWEFGLMLIYTLNYSVPFLGSVAHKFYECAKKREKNDNENAKTQLLCKQNEWQFKKFLKYCKPSELN